LLSPGLDSELRCVILRIESDARPKDLDRMRRVSSRFTFRRCTPTIGGEFSFYCYACAGLTITTAISVCISSWLWTIHCSLGGALVRSGCCSKETILLDVTWTFNQWVGSFDYMGYADVFPKPEDWIGRWLPYVLCLYSPSASPCSSSGIM